MDVGPAQTARRHFDQNSCARASEPARIRRPAGRLIETRGAHFLSRHQTLPPASGFQHLKHFRPIVAPEVPGHGRVISSRAHDCQPEKSRPYRSAERPLAASVVSQTFKKTKVLAGSMRDLALYVDRNVLKDVRFGKIGRYHEIIRWSL